MANYCGTGSGNFPKPGDPDLNNSVISASPAFGGIDITWTYPELNAHAVAHSRLYRSGSADPETRVLLRKVNGDFFYDKTESATPIQYYYWVQHVSINGTIGELLGPASATARPTIEQMIELLTGEINNGLLATALRNRIDEIDTNKDEILAERLDRVNSDDLFASALAGMEQVVADVDTLIRQEVTERTEGDSSIVESLNLLFAQQQDNNALILEEQTVRASADDALASDISTLQAETDTNAAAITSESTTRATVDEALGERIDTVIATSVRIFRADTAPQPGKTPINLNDLWFDTSDGNRLYQWTGLEWVDTQDTGIQAAFAAINSEEQARTTADSALSSRLDTLSASVQDNAADVQTEQQARADADSALASRITTVEASSADNAAAITSESQARADADEALSQQVQTLVASTSQIFRGDTAPDPEARIVNENDLWVNTAEDNRLYQWDGTNWVDAQDGGIGAAFAAIEVERQARTNADGAMAQSITTLEASVGRKTRTYFQANPPALPENIGDLWIDTDNDNALYYWEGPERGWVDGWDKRIVQTIENLQKAQQDALDAMTAAERAQATADKAIRTYYQESAPTGLNDTTDIGDLWYRTTDDQAFRWNGTTWKVIEDSSIAAAMGAAQAAQSTADGKITTFYQHSEPVAEGIGDLWVDLSNDQKLFRWNGSDWVDAADYRIVTALEDAAVADAKAVSAQQAADAAAALAQAEAQQAETEAKAYADGIVSTAEQAAIDAAKAYTDAQRIQTEAFADGIVTASEAAAISAAKAYADQMKLEAQAYAEGEASDAQLAAIAAAEAFTNQERLKAEAYADGVVTASEQATIAAAEAYADQKKLEAQSYAEGQATAAQQAAITAAQAYADEKKLEAQAYADGEVSTAEAEAIAAAKSYTDAQRALAEQTAAAYADGEVTAAEARAIAAAQEKADAAQAAASALAQAAQADADIGKSRNQVFRQPTQPVAENVGDLWFDSDDSDKAYQWIGSKWQPLNLYTGNEVEAAIQDYEATRVGFCMINGSPDSTKDSKAACEAATGTWLDMHAIAEVVKGVQITDGDNERANVEQRMLAYKDDIGNLNSQYTVKVQTDSATDEKIVGGFGLATDTGTGTVEAGFDVDRFWVGKLGKKTFPFIIEGDEVFIKEAVMQKLTFNKLRAEDGSLIAANGLLSATKIDAANLELDYGNIKNVVISNADIVNGAITAAKIADGNITSAKIGNGQITTAKIGNAQVDTLQIKNNAVTLPAGARRTTAIGIGRSWTTVASFTYNHGYSGTIGGLVVGFVSCSYFSDTAETVQARLLVNGSVVGTAKTKSKEQEQSLCLSAYVTLPSGSYTVAVQSLTTLNSGTNGIGTVAVIGGKR